MEKNGIVLLLIGIAVIGAILLEAMILIFAARRAYDWRASLASIGVLFGRVFTDFVPIAIAMPGAYWLYEHRLVDAARYGAWSYVVLFVGVEFAYYWWHRLSHRSRWFWVHHSVHHSPEELNLSAAYRVGWLSRIMSTYIVFGPLAAFGFEPGAIFGAYGLNLAYQFWIHTTWIPKLGPLEGILNTPSAHRVHHASNPEYIDSNYGGVTMIFDRLFGTYRAERDDIAIRYGLVEPLPSYNPFKIVFYPLGKLIRDLSAARTLSDVVGYLFAPPGWRPKNREATAVKRVVA